MNFFEHQRLARRHSLVLVALFLIFLSALSGIIAAVGIALLNPDGWAHSLDFLRSKQGQTLLLKATLSIATLLGLVTLYRTLAFGTSGNRIAEKLGGERVHPDTKDPNERRLLNIVQEMSLASGVPQPSVWLLRSEPSLNAMAAGFDVPRATIICTQGAITFWSRDELQAVIAHEFSHILNGDMRLNLRLTGAISGLVALSEIGRFLISGSRQSGSRSRNQLVPLGLALLVLGAIGVLFARVIQSAISRKRELLADASSCQFTRNPSALASALSKILFSDTHQQMLAPYTLTTSHFFFSNPSSLSLSALFSTHPPLRERIQLLDPTFLDPTLVQKNWEKTQAHSHPTLQMLQARDAQSTDLKLFSQHVLKTFADTRSVPSSSSVDLRKLPNAVLEQLKTWDGASSILKSLIDPTLMHTKEVAQKGARFELSTLAIGTLKQLANAEQKKQIIHEIESILLTLPKPDPFAVILSLMVKHSLFPARGIRSWIKSEINIDTRLKNVVIFYRWLLTHTSMRTEDSKAAFFKGLATLTTKPYSPGSEAREPLTLRRLEESLIALKHLPPAWKERLMRGALELFSHDEKLLIEEIEVFRASSVILGVPIPPLQFSSLSEARA
jgi:Zn-dependent protease with chaperone function